MRFGSVLASLALLVAPGSARGEPLAPGAKAPAFKLQGSDGRTYELSQFLGKQELVLAWFPKAFTPG